MTDDYNTFTDRVARNCAVRRAEQEEQRREEEQRRAQRQQQPSSNEPLVYKTYNNSPAPQSQPGYTMAPHLQDAWNDWAVAHVANGLCEFRPEIDKALDNLADATNKALDDLADEAKKALDDLREKNAKLRSDVEVLRVMIRSQSVGVTRSKRDVA
jgi:hypothetical protein